ncbi:MAG: divalent-cation tolerance protein CutA [Candidatus Sericytochromatia bacterium]|nr:divalent-cation tolerance protein CutA [Candidatus Sericytochromatia bacterium]
MKMVLISHPEVGAEALARILLEERLTACIQISAPVTSLYRWQGEVVHDREVQLWCKTSDGAADALMARIRALHPYEVPEILLLPVEGGWEAYHAWVQEEVRQA